MLMFLSIITRLLVASSKRGRVDLQLNCSRNWRRKSTLFFEDTKVAKLWNTSLVAGPVGPLTFRTIMAVGGVSHIGCAVHHGCPKSI